MKTFRDLLVRDRLWLGDTVQYRLDSFNKSGRIARCTAVQGSTQVKALICDEIGLANFIENDQRINSAITLVIPFSAITSTVRPTPTLNLDQVCEEYDRIVQVAESMEKHSESEEVST